MTRQQGTRTSSLVVEFAGIMQEIFDTINRKNPVEGRSAFAGNGVQSAGNPIDFEALIVAFRR